MRNLSIVSISVALFLAPVFAQDKLVGEALAVIEKHEALLPGLEPGDVRTANSYINALNAAAKRLNGSYDKTSAEWKDATSRYKALVATITARAREVPAPVVGGSAPGGPVPANDKPLDTRALESLRNAIAKRHHSLRSDRASDFVDPARVEERRTTIAEFSARLGQFPKDHPEVLTVRAQLQAFEATLVEKLAELEASRAPAGSREKLDALTTFYGRFEVLKPLEAPFEPSAVEEWATTLARIRDEHLARDLAYVDSLRGKIGIDLQAWQRVRDWIASVWPLRIERLLAESQAHIHGALSNRDFLIQFILEIDPKNPDHISNRLLGEGKLEQNQAALLETLRDIEVAAAFDRGAKSTSPTDYAALKKSAEAALAHLKDCVDRARQHVRLPPAKSEDPQLRLAAAEVLANPKYGVHPVERFVINLDVRRKEKSEASLSGGVITIYDYVWDEFQVATVEKVQGELWIYYNRLKFFHKGGSTTPTGYWILAERFQSTPILPENVGR